MSAAKVATVVLSVFVSAWFVMLALGGAHGYDSRIPALGYWASWWLTLALVAATIPGHINADNQASRHDRR